MLEKVEPPALELPARPHPLPVEPAAPARVIDIVGLYLGQPEHVLALAVQRGGHGSVSPPILPMDLGVSSLLDELAAVTSMLTPQRPGVGQLSAHRAFLSDVDRAVPVELDVHLICLAPAAGPAVRHAGRFSTSRAATEKHWGDQISHFLGHRGARRLRGRTGQISAALHRWLSTRTAQQRHFAWVCEQSRRG
ncbi:hypothetical protein ACIRG5_06215 [Lentzea sp. NPDC102401]|uniref:hypothetical protein n=1 Tax=Lentzea sp. NPDC102401 TaxID=3364128 RepID=UPI003824C068